MRCEIRTDALTNRFSPVLSNRQSPSPRIKPLLALQLLTGVDIFNTPVLLKKRKEEKEKKKGKTPEVSESAQCSADKK